jgi:transposase
MESTGEYWKPVYNILEGNLEVLLVNAYHVKNVPGRKTDVKDAQWLAELLQHGLLKASFIPPRVQRDLRELTRQRSNLVRERAGVVNRLQKVLETANLKLGNVASDILGVSARAMLEAIIAGESDPEQLADLAKGRLRKKRAELTQALSGRVRAQHCFMLTQHLAHIDFLDEQIELFNQEIEGPIKAGPTIQLLSPVPKCNQPERDEANEQLAVEHSEPLAKESLTLNWQEAVTLLDTITGVNQRVAELIIAEIGSDMSRFPSADHLASWAGVSPTNKRSAGKQLPGQVSSGDRPVRKILIQAAHAAALSKDTYLAALYNRLAARRGKRRAIIAVAHSMVVSIYYMLTRKEEYRELGYNYQDKRSRETAAKRLIKRLARLGYQVKACLPPGADQPAGQLVGP